MASGIFAFSSEGSQDSSLDAATGGSGNNSEDDEPDSEKDEDDEGKEEDENEEGNDGNKENMAIRVRSILVSECNSTDCSSLDSRSETFHSCCQDAGPKTCSLIWCSRAQCSCRIHQPPC